jgi:hypothetical protein
MTAKRSAYTTEQLDDIINASPTPVRVIDFLLVGHFDPVITLSELIEMDVFRGWPPQSITHLSEERFEKLRSRMNFWFAV